MFYYYPEMAKELVKSLDERTSSLCTNPCLFYEETEYKHNMDKLINKEEKIEKEENKMNIEEGQISKEMEKEDNKIEAHVPKWQQTIWLSVIHSLHPAFDAS